MHLRHYQLYIFDFDFTLFDTSQGQIQCARAAFASGGITNVSDEEIKREMGIPLREFFGKYTDDTSVIDRMQQEFLGFSAEGIAELAKPCKSTLRVVTELQSRGAKLAICTGNYRDRASRILARFSLEELFDTIVCAEDITKGKPDPEGLLRCLAQFEDIAKSQVAYIGDHHYDILMAQRCGIDSIAITSGMMGRRELLQFTPTYIIYDLSELL